MIRAAEAIVIDENFGPKAKEEKETMPALQSTQMWVKMQLSLFQNIDLLMSVMADVCLQWKFSEINSSNQDDRKYLECDSLSVAFSNSYS